MTHDHDNCDCYCYCSANASYEYELVANSKSPQGDRARHPDARRVLERGQRREGPIFGIWGGLVHLHDLGGLLVRSVTGPTFKKEFRAFDRTSVPLGTGWDAAE